MKFRKRFLILTALLLFISNTIIAVAGNNTKEPDVKAYVKVQTVLNLRDGPSTNSKVLSKIKPGELVIVEETFESGWSKVKLDNGTEGYVSSQYIVIPEMDTQQYELISAAVITQKNSSKNRNFNLAKACEAINGRIYKPDEEFNWYGDADRGIEAVVGEASIKNGYKTATVLVNSKPVDGEGGGVCQVSTAVYNCIYKLDIEPTELVHHSKASSYVEKGMDATVAYPNKNFAFKNTKDYPIMFEAYSEDGQVVVVAYKMLEDKK